MDNLGLTSAEASERFAKYGPNELEKKGKVTILGLFLEQFDNFIILLLLAAAAISLYIGDSLEAIAIFIAAMLSVSLSVIQEYRGEQAMESLIKLTSLKARAIRDGNECVIETLELVPGDAVIVSEGDKVPADLEILKSTSLSVDESMLTGESTTVEKDACLDGEGKRLYMGTVISRGKATCLVKETGMSTEMGRIVKTMMVKEDKTPLQKKLDWLASRVGIAGIVSCGIVFIIGSLFYPKPWNEMFLIAVTLAIASVPEGLATTVTITLAIGMKKMASRNAIVRKLLAVESLGSVTVVCTDKTGTITQNKMTVRKMFADMQEVDVTGEGYDGPGRLLINGELVGKPGGALALLLQTGVLCNASAISRKEGRAEVIGDPTEVALLVLAEKAGIDYVALRKTSPGEGEPLFDSKRKLMVSINESKAGRFLLVKGAFESVVERSTHLMTEEGDGAMRKADAERLAIENESLATQGLRVLAFAYKKLDKKRRDKETDEDLVFLGLVGMIDPPREEAYGAVRDCKSAGIRVIMITGDNPITARAIAQEVGIFTAGDRVLTGAEMTSMSERDLRAISDSVSVYARVLPEQKLRIVSALQAGGNIVAMTGDGVNDVPGIKKADVGVAMGSGTDVAKESSDVVLADDNFATIVSAVKYGRSIYDNIRNFVRFQFSTNIAAVVTMFVVTFTRLPMPFTPLQLLWINIIMDGPPALALGLEPTRGNIMKQKPRNPKESIVSGLLVGVVTSGAMMCAGTIILLLLAERRDPIETGTVAFTGFVVFQLFNALNCRSNKDSIVKDFWSNRYLMLALVASAVLQLLIIYTPALQEVFKTTALEFDDWVIIVCVAISVIIIEEARKFMLRKVENRKEKQAIEGET
ncbi:MAG: cation-transporting P-type ATPase [Candidatus Micrarchaeota archaeon]